MAGQPRKKDGEFKKDKAPARPAKAPAVKRPPVGKGKGKG
jgi:hypothetical protein